MFFPQGFLPVIYTWFKSRRQSSAVHLPSNSDDDSHIPNKLTPSPEPLTGWKILLLWIPAACDLTGTTVSLNVFPCVTLVEVSTNASFYQLMNIGLLYTPVSIYQMSRGALVLFVGFFSVVFLRRRLWLYQFGVLCCSEYI